MGLNLRNSRYVNFLSGAPRCECSLPLHRRGQGGLSTRPDSRPYDQGGGPASPAIALRCADEEPSKPLACVHQPSQRRRRQCASKRGAVWLRQEQMAELFGRQRIVIGRHIRNVFADGEPVRESNVQNLHIANSDKPVSLD